MCKVFVVWYTNVRKWVQSAQLICVFRRVFFYFIYYPSNIVYRKRKKIGEEQLIF